MKTSYFTLGQQHVHKYGSYTLDKDVVIKITGLTPRATMFELFGSTWAMEYEYKPPNMKYFPRGVFDLNEGEFQPVHTEDKSNED